MLNKLIFITTLLLFASPQLNACAINGKWELDSDAPVFLDFQPEGKLTITQGKGENAKVNSDVHWRCDSETLSIYNNSDNKVVKQFTDIRMMGGIITVTNKDGEMEAYLYHMSEEKPAQ